MEEIIELSQLIQWQITDGAMRKHYCNDDEALYSNVNTIDDTKDNGCIMITEDDNYHRLVLIQKSAIDYISFPTNKYINGMITIAMKELGC